MSKNGTQELPPGWVESSLGEVLPLSYGKGLTEKQRDTAGQVPVYGSSGIVGRHAQTLTSGPTLIVGRKGSVGEVHYSHVPCWPIDTTYFVEATESTNLPFFGYLLQAVGLGRLDKSTTIPGLSRDDYNVTKVTIPPLPEQHCIVAEIEKQITRLDTAVAALKRTQANLKRYRAAVLKAACEGRLVETEAELASKEGRDYEPADRLLARILNERRTKWEADQLAKMQAQGKIPRDDKWKEKYQEPVVPDTTDLPELPEGWVWATVEAVSSVIVDCPHSTPVWTENGKICVRTTEFRPGYLDLLNVRYVSELTYRKRIERLTPRERDILYSREGGILGIACMVPSGVDLCLGQRMMLIRVNKKIIASFVMHVLNSVWTLMRVRSLTGGSASPHLNVGDVKLFPIPVPPLTEQHRVVAEVERRLSVIDELETTVNANLKRAERLRQAILKRAFEGKLVPQDPNDEPASVLLERIRAERAVGATGRSPLRAGHNSSTTGRAPLQTGGKKRNSRASEAQAELFRSV